MGMNKSLQKHIISELLRKHNIDPQTVDLDAEIDSNLTLEENIKNISKKLGIPLTKALEEIRENKADDEYTEQKNLELQEEYLRMNGIDPEELSKELEEEEEKEKEGLSAEEEEILAHREQMAEIFRENVKRYGPTYYAKYLFPEIIGDQYDYARKAILLALATHRDVQKRTRIHVLLVGPPGSGKTEILLWLRDKLGAYFVNAEYASKVGLAGDARGKELTPGALAEADGSVMVIDELDKMSPKDQNALLQAMEEGKYTIIKGKFRETLRAEVRVVAAANDLDRIIKPLRDRFDFIIKLEPPSKGKRAKEARILVREFTGKYQPPEVDVLLEYLNWIRPEPQVSDEEEEKMEDVMEAYINMIQRDITEESRRSLEFSILRISYALAKLERSDWTAEHIVKAIRLKEEAHGRKVPNETLEHLLAIAKGLIKRNKKTEEVLKV